MGANHLAPPVSCNLYKFMSDPLTCLYGVPSCCPPSAHAFRTLEKIAEYHVNIITSQAIHLYIL